MSQHPLSKLKSRRLLVDGFDEAMYLEFKDSERRSENPVSRNTSNCDFSRVPAPARAGPSDSRRAGGRGVPRGRLMSALVCSVSLIFAVKTYLKEFPTFQRLSFLCGATQLPHNFCISAWPMQKYFCNDAIFMQKLCRSYELS